MIKDKKASFFYLFNVLIFLSFGIFLRELSNNFINYQNILFSITNVKNTGCAFGFLENYTTFLGILGIFAITYASIFVFKKISYKEKFMLFSIILFSAGTLGNVIERLYYGYVLDYIKLNFINFPVFNAFDIMLCISILLFSIAIIKNKE